MLPYSAKSQIISLVVVDTMAEEYILNGDDDMMDGRCEERRTK